MTVKELKEKLNEYDDDLEIVYLNDGYYFQEIEQDQFKLVRKHGESNKDQLCIGGSDLL